MRTLIWAKMFHLYKLFTPPYWRFVLLLLRTSATDIGFMKGFLEYFYPELGLVWLLKKIRRVLVSFVYNTGLLRLSNLSHKRHQGKEGHFLTHIFFTTFFLWLFKKKAIIVICGCWLWLIDFSVFNLYWLVRCVINVNRVCLMNDIHISLV